MREFTPAGTASEAWRDDSAIELQTPDSASSSMRDNPYALHADPIPPEWILEGNPITRRKLLVRSSDNTDSAHMWDCTAGRFNWYYVVDEVIHVLEGSVVVEDDAGVRRKLGPGDTFLFPAGTRFHWTVPNYIRKVAFLHPPLSRKMRFAKRTYDFFMWPFKRKRAVAVWTG